MRRYFPFAALAHPRRANPLVLAAAMLALGLAAGAMLRPALTPGVRQSSPRSRR